MITPPSGPASLVQAPSVAGLPKSGDLQISTLDYDEHGRVTISGQASAGTVVLAYVDNKMVAEGQTDIDGRWRLAPTDSVAAGQHRLRLDRLAKDGRPIARLELPFERLVVQPGASDTRRAGRGARRQSVEHGAGPLRPRHAPHPDLRRQQGPDPQSRSDLSGPSIQPAQGQLRACSPGTVTGEARAREVSAGHARSRCRATILPNRGFEEMVRALRRHRRARSRPRSPPAAQGAPPATPWDPARRQDLPARRRCGGRGRGVDSGINLVHLLLIELVMREFGPSSVSAGEMPASAKVYLAALSPLRKIPG